METKLQTHRVSLADTMSRPHTKITHSSLSSFARTPTTPVRPKRACNRKRKRSSTRTPSAKPRRQRVPDWAEYMYGPGFREQFLANKLINDSAWERFKQACARAFKSRKQAKDRGHDTPARARELRRGGLESFVRRASGRPLDTGDSFASLEREKHPEILALSPSHDIHQSI